MEGRAAGTPAGAAAEWKFAQASPSLLCVSPSAPETHRRASLMPRTTLPASWPSFATSSRPVQGGRSPCGPLPATSPIVSQVVSMAAIGFFSLPPASRKCRQAGQQDVRCCAHSLGTTHSQQAASREGDAMQSLGGTAGSTGTADGQCRLGYADGTVDTAGLREMSRSTTPCRVLGAKSLAVAIVRHSTRCRAGEGAGRQRWQQVHASAGRRAAVRLAAWAGAAWQAVPTACNAGAIPSPSSQLCKDTRRPKQRLKHGTHL